MVVLDSSAIIAVLKNEPGSETVVSQLANAAVSAVNLQEIANKMLQAGAPEPIIRQAIAELGVIVMPHDGEDAFQAAALTSLTRKFGSGLGDRSCMALAIRLGVPALTTDRAWTKLEIPGLEVRLAR
ncbi:MAG: type II toxin-antitoxin system VapC family toxin [Rhizobiaceae bacterium]|nr:type II toxin-antitoxin system VapC family toxin [Rhizobiaceae bacterium]